MTSSAVKYYYQDPRLNMTPAGRFIVRLVSYATYGVLTVGGVVLWSAQDVPQLHALGALLILFLLSRLVASGKPERSLARISMRHANIAEYVDPAAYKIIEKAVDRVALHGGSLRLYVLQELARQQEVRQILVRLGVDVEAFNQKVNQHVDDALKERISPQEVQAAVEGLMRAAFTKAVGNYGTAVKSYYIFGALGELADERIKQIFGLFSISGEDVETAFLFGKGRRSGLRGFVHGQLKKRHRVMNRAWTARPTPILDSVSVDITDVVREIGSWLLVGHEQEYERLLNTLARPGNPRALLVGEPGSGKTAMVYNLAFQINKDRVPRQLFDKRLVSLSVSSLMAGADEVEISKRLSLVLAEIIAAGNIILYIPDLHELLEQGRGGRSGADLLLESINKGEFPVIGGTSVQQFKKAIEPKSEFSASFEVITVSPLSEQQAVRYLIYASLVLEAQQKIVITFGAIKEAARLGHRYFSQKPLPGSAEDLLKESLAGVALRHGEVLTADDVIGTAERKVNIKMHTAAGAEADQLLHLEDLIHKKIIGQNEAVVAVADALREYRAGVTRKGGPIASFLFCGPTGVGKTELSKVLAEAQFGDKNAMTRFDMTEYQDKQSYYRLIGSPDGVMRGLLTDAVLEKPYSLILLDEIEKAYPDILNLFLQVLDDGRLTDNLGRTVDFSNTIIIATSNAHSTLIKEQLESGESVAAISQLLKKRLTEIFRPELINRFSGIIVFKPLSPEEIVAVARINLADLSATLTETQAVSLKYEDSAVTEIARRGFDAVFGARPLRRVINDCLRSVLAEQILRGMIKRGDSITVAYRDGAFCFDKTA